MDVPYVSSVFLSDMEAFELMQGLVGAQQKTRTTRWSALCESGKTKFFYEEYCYYNDDLDSVGMTFSGRWAWDSIYQCSIHVIRTMGRESPPKYTSNSTCTIT